MRCFPLSGHATKVEQLAECVEVVFKHPMTDRDYDSTLDAVEPMDSVKPLNVTYTIVTDLVARQ